MIFFFILPLIEPVKNNLIPTLISMDKAEDNTRWSIKCPDREAEKYFALNPPKYTLTKCKGLLCPRARPDERNHRRPLSKAGAQHCEYTTECRANGSFVIT